MSCGVSEKSSACSVRIGRYEGKKRIGRHKPKSRWKVKSIVKKKDGKA